jgi:hypothetical protein
MQSTATPDTAAMINALDNASWRELLLAQLDASVSAYDRNFGMFKALQAAEKAGKLSSNLAPSDRDYARLIELAMVGEFPTREPWHPVGADILSWFWTLTHPCFLPVVETNYAQATDPSRGYALTLLAAQGTPEATTSIAKLVQEHALPEHLPPRFFWEFNKRHAAVGPLLFPKLLLDAGPHLSEVMNFLNLCLEEGTLKPDALTPASDWATNEAAKLLDTIEPLQQNSGKQWRWDEEYQQKRSQLGVFLDLLGIIPAANMGPCARAVLLRDPLCAFFAVISMLKKNLYPPSAAIRLVADSFETRVSLHTQLARVGRGDLFPADLLTFESFAAASMTEWLLYPSELGYEPAELELVAKVSGTSEDAQVIMCLWKVTAEDGSAFAAASGPYQANVTIGPLFGENTFSNFTDWQSCTPDEHLKEIIETLDRWSVEWCERGK